MAPIYIRADQIFHRPRVYEILEGGLNSKMAAHRDVTEYPQAKLWRHWRAFNKKINGIPEVCRNNSSNFEIKLETFREHPPFYYWNYWCLATIRWGLQFCRCDGQKIE